MGLASFTPSESFFALSSVLQAGGCQLGTTVGRCATILTDCYGNSSIAEDIQGRACHEAGTEHENLPRGAALDMQSSCRLHLTYLSEAMVAVLVSNENSVLCRLGLYRRRCAIDSSSCRLEAIVLR
jgi:hypothetical protein